MHGGFHLRVFGPPVLLDQEGHLVAFRTQKQMALLVHLALERGGVSREVLVDLLWPTVILRKGRHSLSQGLTAIKRVLGPGAVERTGRLVKLGVHLPTDLDVVGNSRHEALELDRPLRDLDRLAGVDFAHWVDGQRRKLLNTVRAELTSAFHDARRQGEAAAVHTFARQLYSVDAGNDTAVQALAECALLEGSVGKAIELLRDFLDRNVGDADRDRHSAISRLLERIESGAHPPTTGIVAAGVKTPDAEEHFVGRTEELGKLEAFWGQARNGGLRTCLLSGVGGIGKSSLLRRFATSIAARGNTALLVTCQEIGKAIPFATLADLIDQLSKDSALGGTDPHWLAEASRIAPVLKARYPGLPTPDIAPGESIRLRVAEAFYRMLETVTEGTPFLIAIDDVQHLDQASRDVLHVLGRRLADTPALILRTTRTEGFDSAASHAKDLSDLGASTQTMDIRSLDPKTASALVKLLADDLGMERAYGATVEEIVRLAGGNPYFLEMLVSDWRAHRESSLAVTEAEGDLTKAKWRPPEALRQAFSRHYRGLGSGPKQILDVLSAAGRAMSTTELSGLLGVSAAGAGRMMLQVIERGVLRIERDTLSFKNELHRAFVYYAMSDETRRFHHAAIARMPLAIDRDDALRALEASHHFTQANMWPEALESALTGAKEALSRGAPREAQRALLNATPSGEAPSSRAILLLGEALNQQGQYREAIDWLDRLNGSETTPQQRRKVAGLRAEAMVRGRLGSETEIRVAVERGLNEARRAESGIEVLKVLQTAAEYSADQNDLEGLAAAEREARSLVGTSDGDEVWAHAQLTAGFCLWVRGRFADAFWRFSNAAEFFETVGHANQIRAQHGRAISAVAIGEYCIAIEAWERALTLAERTGDYGVACNIASNASTVCSDLGDFQQAQDRLEQAISLEKHTSNNRYSFRVFSDAASLCILQQEFAEAASWLERAKDAVQPTKLPTGVAQLMFIQADYHLARQSPEEALSVIAAAESKISLRHITASYQSNVLRLTEYREWRLGRGDLMTTRPPTDKPRLPLADFVELCAFREWLAQQKGHRTLARPNTRDLVRATGLKGVEHLLRLTGMYPDEDG